MKMMIMMKMIMIVIHDSAGGGDSDGGEVETVSSSLTGQRRRRGHVRSPCNSLSHLSHQNTQRSHYTRCCEEDTGPGDTDGLHTWPSPAPQGHSWSTLSPREGRKVRLPLIFFFILFHTHKHTHFKSKQNNSRFGDGTV